MCDSGVSSSVLIDVHMASRMNLGIQGVFTSTDKRNQVFFKS